MTTAAPKAPKKQAATKKTAKAKPAAADKAKPTAKKAAAPKKPATRKSAAPKKPAATNPVNPTKAAVPASAKPTPEVVNAPEAVVVGPPIRKKEIIESVVARSGLKKRDVKPVVDHVLAVMGDALGDGRELIVPPLGRVKIHKKKDALKKTIFFAKIHQNAPPAVIKVGSDDDKDL